MLRNLPNNLSLQEVVSKNFPTNGSLVIFLLYMAMFVAQVQPLQLPIINVFSSRKPYSLLQGVFFPKSSKYGEKLKYPNWDPPKKLNGENKSKL